MSLDIIQQLTRDFADAREILSNRVQNLNDEIDAAKRRLLPGIKKAVDAAKERKEALRAAIEQNPTLFVSPRTMVFFGVKVGMQKGKGKIEWEDADQVVKLIKKHLPEKADTLVKTTEKPIKKAISNLSVADLKKLGITVAESGDTVVIAPTDSDVDKIVSALLEEKGAEEED